MRRRRKEGRGRRRERGGEKKRSGRRRYNAFPLQGLRIGFRPFIFAGWFITGLSTKDETSETTGQNLGGRSLVFPFPCNC